MGRPTTVVWYARGARGEAVRESAASVPAPALEGGFGSGVETPVGRILQVTAAMDEAGLLPMDTQDRTLVRVVTPDADPAGRRASTVIHAVVSGGPSLLVREVDADAFQEELRSWIDDVPPSPAID